MGQAGTWFALSAVVISVGWGVGAAIGNARLHEAIDANEHALEDTTQLVRRLTARIDALDEASSVDDDARVQFRAGVDAFDIGDYEGARAAFQKAYDLKKHPATLLNLAWATFRSGRPVDAQGLFQRVMDDGATTERQRAGANEGLGQARAAVAQLGAAETQPPSAPAPSTAPQPAATNAMPVLPPPPASGFLNINSVPPSSAILDGQVLGTTPRIHVAVRPGTHVVQFANSERGTTENLTVFVAAGETRPAVVRFGKRDGDGP